MANFHSAGKEPAPRWNQRQLRDSITNKLKEMDLQIDSEQLKAVMLEQKNELLANCPSNIGIKDFVTEQITSQIINRLAMQGSLTFSPHTNSQPAGMATEAHYRQEFFNMTESLRARLLMDETESSTTCDQKMKDMLEISQEVWELMKPDLSRRQDTDPRFRDWMPRAREYIEVICALKDNDERRSEIAKVKRKRAKLDADASEDSKGKDESEQKQASKAQKTLKKNRRLNLDAPQSSQRTPMRAAASSSTDSVRTQSLNAEPSGANGLQARLSLTFQEILETPKSEQKIKFDKKAIDVRMEELFGTDDEEEEEISPQQSEPANEIALDEEILVPNAPGFKMQIHHSTPRDDKSSPGPSLRDPEKDEKLDELERQESIMGP